MVTRVLTVRLPDNEIDISNVLELAGMNLTNEARRDYRGICDELSSYCGVFYTPGQLMAEIELVVLGETNYDFSTQYVEARKWISAIFNALLTVVVKRDGTPEDDQEFLAEFAKAGNAWHTRFDRVAKVFAQAKDDDGGVALLAYQQAFLVDDTLPTLVPNLGGWDCMEFLRQAGVTYNGPVEGRPELSHVSMPPGMRKVLVPNGTYLLQDQGRTRAAIINNWPSGAPGSKPAVYVRPRFSIDIRVMSSTPTRYCARVMDGDTIILELQASRKKGFVKQRNAMKQAERWLNEHQYRWRDPGAYWDDD